MGDVIRQRFTSVTLSRGIPHAMMAPWGVSLVSEMAPLGESHSYDMAPLCGDGCGGCLMFSDGHTGGVVTPRLH